VTEWCPVAERDAVAKGPVRVELADDDIVVFKTATGTPAALQAHCPHRGMLLSCGTVHDDVITCPYHGWSFDRYGRGTNAAGQDRGQCAVSYDTHEAFGLVWVKSAGAPADFPQLCPAGLEHLHTRFDVAPETAGPPAVGPVGRIGRLFAIRPARLHQIAYVLPLANGRSAVAAIYFGHIPDMRIPLVGSIVRWALRRLPFEE